MNYKALINNIILAIRIRLYRGIYTPYKIMRIRRKTLIRVVFVVENLGAWKTEDLYKEMLVHPKFEPILYFSKNFEEDDRKNLAKYAITKGYKYYIHDTSDVSLWDRYYPDIIFYQKPYGYKYLKNLKSLFCYISYGRHGSILPYSIKNDHIYNCWQVYFENEVLADEYSKLRTGKRRNYFATGLPTMDEFSVDKETLHNPWKTRGRHKRIIYAPHHSIDPANWWQSSTFLKIGEEMLALAEKYSDRVQWAFKPHPLLRGKLERIWGEEKTEYYYSRWAEMEWSQYESGTYLGLFKHSDAMIHDCGAFIEEYLYTGNPVMFLIRDEISFAEFKKTINKTYRSALLFHNIGEEISDVENFIVKILNGDNYLERNLKNEFVKNSLLSPNNQTSSQNIIDCILNEGAFKAF